MKEGDVVLALLPQKDGLNKPRPAVLLRRMPGFGDLLVCGISTQLRQQVADFDEIIESSHADFKASGLKATSLIRLGFLAVLPASSFLGDNRFHFRGTSSTSSFKAFRAFAAKK
jgi:mRNA interferase MazF